MKVKRCIRCGNFYISEESACSACLNKDRADVKIIKNYFEENEKPFNLVELSAKTNISEKNIIRLMENNGEIANVNIIGTPDFRIGNINL